LTLLAAAHDTVALHDKMAANEELYVTSRNKLVSEAVVRDNFRVHFDADCLHVKIFEAALIDNVAPRSSNLLSNVAVFG
jgi:hypothetical protein